MKTIYLFAVVILCVLFLPLWGQQSIKSIAKIEEEITSNNIVKAEQSLNANIQYWKSKRNLDTLITFIRLKGKIGYKSNNVKKATASIYQYISELQKLGLSPRQTVDAYQEATAYFDEISQFNESFKATAIALENAENLKIDKEKIIAQCHYNLGVQSGKMGNLELSKEHHLKAMKYRQSLKNGDPEDMYFSNNAIGSLFWYSSNYDSAQYYFNSALENLKKMSQNSINRYYRPAIIKNNIAAINGIEGENTKAIETMKSVIDNFQKFINSDGDQNKKIKAQQNSLEAIDNLAALYREIGDYTQAGNLLKYSYLQKKQKLDKSYYGVFISEILLGQFYRLTGADEEAKKYLDMGLAHLESADGDFTFWEADAWYSLALLYEERKNYKLAAQYYEKSEQLYEDAYSGMYDNIYMDFLRNLSLFYAHQNDYKKAIDKSKKVYSYLKTVGSDKKLPGFYQLLNFAEINYLTQHYQKAIEYSDAALNLLAQQFNSSNSVLDSVKINLYKPKAILIEAKSRYALQPNKDSAFLLQIYQKLDTAISVLQTRKTLIDDPQNINHLMVEQKELIDFYSKIALELYNKKMGSLYLEKFINLKESALFARIRNRLNQENAISYSKVSSDMLLEEQKIKAELKSIIDDSEQNTTKFNDYLNALSKWDHFLVSIKEKYPKYYRLRFATLFQPISELNALVPENSTIIRYYFTDTSLIALLIDKKSVKVIPLNSNGLEERIKNYLAQQMSEEKQLNLLHQIYTQIWEPIDAHLSTKKIIVIPDGILYNISLDMLPFEPIQHFRQLATKSLLSKYSFTYNYSLFTLENKEEKIKSNNNYIAFAPGFSDELKKKYTSTLQDSMDLDLVYLKLLPQPTSNQLTKEIKSKLGGKLFINEASTISNFKENANNNKIIFLATHAKYNNSLPEQSGLYFAKSSESKEDNFLSLKDIYDCELNADLMVLTACESGRPGYNDGEGLVSLANAVNYSGSKNILTGLWEIDEQSSAFIAKQFIQNITKGLSTDDALRQAKLTYLNENQGRVLAPAYWSGLVLIGSPEILELTTVTNSNYFAFLTTIIVLLFIFLLIFQLKKKQRIQY